jgi:membrane dipeptidase
MMIVDAHLDLSYNAMRGRAVERPAREQAADEEGIPTVGLPDLRKGGVGLVGATIFWANPGEAREAAGKQLQWYRQREEGGELRRVRTWPADLSRQAGQTQMILLLEGADAIRDEGDAQWFFDAGVRLVGLTWKDGSRFAGGNAKPGPLTSDGIAMVKILDRLGIIHDASHLAEQSFWPLMETAAGPVMASHSNCRAIVPGERQLSDEMIRAIAGRGGVIGINFYDQFLLSPGEIGKRRATLKDVARHVRHICEVAGTSAAAGLGTDMDGGLGREQIPVEIETSADLPRVAQALSDDGFSDTDVAGVLGGNWLRYFGRWLERGQT